MCSQQEKSSKLNFITELKMSTIFKTGMPSAHRSCYPRPESGRDYYSTAESPLKDPY